MGKPKRLYGNIIDPDLCRVIDLLKVAETMGVNTKGSEERLWAQEEPYTAIFDPVPIKRKYKGLCNPAIFDEFYKEVVTTISDYPYLRFIDKANQVYDEAYDNVLNEATPVPEVLPDWFENVFLAIEWDPVKTFLGDMPNSLFSDLIRDSVEDIGVAEALVKERCSNLSGAIAYVLKNGTPRRLVGAIWSYIVARVMEMVVSDIRLTINVSHVYGTFPAIPIQILGTENTDISTTVVTKLDLDAIIRAMRVVACYGVDVNVSELLRVYSVASMQRSICSMKSTEDAGEAEEGEDVAVDDVVRDDDVYDDEEE